jgi:hypothetical protein
VPAVPLVSLERRQPVVVRIVALDFLILVVMQIIARAVRPGIILEDFLHKQVVRHASVGNIRILLVQKMIA